MQRWNDLGRDNTGQGQWDRTLGGGGGAVGWNSSGQRNMWFKISPTATAEPDMTSIDHNVDYYFHETTHFFQNTFVGTANMGNTPCWFGEGSAMLVGFANSFNAETSNFQYSQIQRAAKIAELKQYLAPQNPDASNILNLLTSFPLTSPQCQFQSPQLGYGLGWLVSEKLVGDFGFLSFIDFMKAMNQADWQTAFERNYGMSVSDWYQNSLIPYLVKILN